MSRLDYTLEPERPLRRFEVITGSGSRRRWSIEEKARIIEETFVPGAVVSEVARRHGLTPQQLFAWRRTARQALAKFGEPPALFVPAVMEAAPSTEAAASGTPRRRQRRLIARSASGIELEIDDVVMRIGADAKPSAISAVIRALKAGS